MFFKGLARLNDLIEYGRVSRNWRSLDLQFVIYFTSQSFKLFSASHDQTNVHHRLILYQKKLVVGFLAAYIILLNCYKCTVAIHENKEQIQYANTNRAQNKIWYLFLKIKHKFRYKMLFHLWHQQSLQRNTNAKVKWYRSWFVVELISITLARYHGNSYE